MNNLGEGAPENILNQIRAQMMSQGNQPSENQPLDSIRNEVNDMLQAVQAVNSLLNGETTKCGLQNNPNNPQEILAKPACSEAPVGGQELPLIPAESVCSQTSCDQNSCSQDSQEESCEEEQGCQNSCSENSCPTNSAPVAQVENPAPACQVGMVVEVLKSVQKHLNSCSETVQNVLSQIKMPVEVAPEKSLQLSHAGKRVLDTLSTSKDFIKVSTLQKASGLQKSSVRSFIAELRKAGYVIESAAALRKVKSDLPKNAAGYRLVSAPKITISAEQKLLLTFSEAARMVGMTTVQFNQLVKSRSLPVVRLSKSIKRIDISDLKGLIKKSRQK